MVAEGLSATERQRLLLSVGTHRGQRPLSPSEVASLFSRILETGGTLSDCARAANLDGTTWVTRFLRLLSLPESVRHLIDWGGNGAGSVTFSSASEIARLDNDEDKEVLVQGALTHRLSGAEVRQVVQLRRRSGRTLNECLEEVVGMRPRIEKRHVYVGAITLDELKCKLKELTQNERDTLLRGIAERILAPATISAAKLGASKFALSGDAKFGAAVNKKKDTLEAEINERLAMAAGR